MTLRVETLTQGPRAADDWPLPERSPFMGSSDQKRLLSDLRRYSQGEIAGRSYLISGHRGAGKTAVTLRAIEDLRYQLLQDALKIEAPLGSRRRGLQRPLLVKLHGPSLVEAAARRATAGDDDDDDASAAEAAETGRSSKTPRTPKAKTAKTSGEASQSESAAHSVLVQITIALYRQLATEAAHGYAIKARAFGVRGGVDGEELAAQLLLDLDSGADPATLRNYWARIDRLKSGVFWPRQTEQVLHHERISGQGLKEILALSTAAQAFRVCTGRVRQSFQDTSALARKAEAKAAGSSDLKNLVGRLGALGVGGVSGAALWSTDHLAAVGLGAVVWLLGSATVSWTVSQTRKRNLEDKYSFLPTKAVENLDRDLPLVIQRIRDAGLAPVFVVDELDKLQNPSETVAEIINRLKHIIADFGFFCFLTDRSYYDHVQQRLDASAYPTEHTYFGERRLLVYTPDDFIRHHLTVLVVDGDATPADDLARTLLALHLTHRSRLNFVDANRELATIIDEGVLALSSDDIARQPRFRLNATLQLAINLVLREADLANRMKDDKAFAQIVYDGLYDIARVWAKGAAQYDASHAQLKACLVSRARNAGVKGAAPDEPVTISPDDLKDVLDARARLIGYLSDFDELARDLAAVSDLAALADITTLDGPRKFLSRETDGSLTFLFEWSGDPKVDSDTSTTSVEVEELIGLLQAFEKLLAEAKATPGDLLAAQLIPPSLSKALLDQALANLKSWIAGVIPSEDLKLSLGTARELRGLLAGQGARLAAGLMLARRVSQTTGGRASLSDALAAMGRYPVFGPAAAGAAWVRSQWDSSFPSLKELGVFTIPRAEVASLEAFGADFAGSHFVRDELEGAVADLWTRWHTRMKRFFDGFALRDQDFGLDDLTTAAMRLGPSAMLRSDLGAMSVGEWSDFALKVLQGQDIDAHPRWALVAALRALRFEVSLLLRLTTEPGPRGRSLSDTEMHLAAPMMYGAPEGRRGLIVQVPDHLAVTDAVPASGPAQLYISSSSIGQFDLALDWLTALQAFEGQADEL